MRKLKLMATVIALACFATTVQADVNLSYDAGVAGGGPADLDPVLQGWSANEVNDGSAVPGDQNVFFLQPDGTTGFNATQLNDQHGGTPTDNPRYESLMTSGDFQNMFDNGWQFDFRFRPEEGGGFVAWGINPTTVTDPGWGLTDRERVGFGVSIVTADNSANVSPIGGAAINFGADSADGYHLISAVGAAGSSSFDIFADGVFNQTIDISDGTSNGGSDDRTFWESGSSGGTGRVSNWNHVSLTAVPEPSSALVLCLGLIGIAARRRR